MITELKTTQCIIGAVLQIVDGNNNTENNSNNNTNSNSTNNTNNNSSVASQ